MYGIDTRRLTKIIRESGVMNARITAKLPEDLSPVLKELAHTALRMQSGV